MYAVIEVGSKQYSVKKDDIIEVDKQNIEKGKDIALDKVLLVADDDKIEIGRPYLKEAKVKVTVLGEIKGAKTIAYKYRRRKAYHLTKGHREQLTRLKIIDIKI